MNINEKLARAVRLFPLAIAFLFSCILVCYTVIQNREKVDFLTSSLQQEFLEDQKQWITSQALQLEMQSESQARDFYQSITVRVNGRLNVARNIVEDVYNANRHKPVEEITAIIATVLGNLHFQNKSEYFFICTTDGVAILSPGLPEYEGASMWDLRDKNGTYYIREFIRRKHGDGDLMVWWFPKPGGPMDVTHKKMGNVFYFAPCELVIGTGDYVDNIKNELEDGNLKWIEQVYSQEFDKVLVFDRQENIRFRSDNTFEKEGGLDALGCSIAGEPLRFADVEKKKQYGLFASVECRESVWSGDFYFRVFPGWDWVVASSVDTGRVAPYLHDKTTIIRQQNMISLFLILVSCLGLIALVGWLTIFVSRRVSQYLSEKLLHDELTGLPNLSYFLMQVKSKIEAGELVAIINLDIDHFNGINERFSREAGDLLLRQITGRLLSVIPENQLCHVESDEFLIFLQRAKQEGERCCAPMAKINELRALFTQPFFLEESRIEISFSSGCCGSAMENSSVKELIRRAGITLFRAKEWGRDSHGCYFLLKDQIERDRQLVEALSGAIERGEISVVYQPLFVAQSGAVFRLEALSRWEHPEMGVVGPEEFIPIAEKNGFILSFGLFLVKKVCMDMLHLMDNGRGAPVVSINISSRQLLDSSFVESITEVIDEAGLDRGRIKLEMTENLLNSDLDTVLPVLEKLKDEGFELALDDFGTGASSLSYINQIPVTELKIDRSFVAGLPADSQGAALVRSIVAVAAANDMLVVAEGVETKAQSEWLENEGCDLMQGYYYSLPMTLEELQVLYQNDRQLLTAGSRRTPTPQPTGVDRVVKEDPPSLQKTAGLGTPDEI